MKAKNKDLIQSNKMFVLLALLTGLILLVPLTAMQFTNEVNWSLSDFTILGALLFCMGSIFIHVARIAKRKYRTLITIGFILLTLWIWAELAVGVFTNLGS